MNHLKRYFLYFSSDLIKNKIQLTLLFSLHSSPLSLPLSFSSSFTFIFFSFSHLLCLLSSNSLLYTQLPFFPFLSHIQLSFTFSTKYPHLILWSSELFSYLVFFCPPPTAFLLRSLVPLIPHLLITHSPKFPSDGWVLTTPVPVSPGPLLHVPHIPPTLHCPFSHFLPLSF